MVGCRHVTASTGAPAAGRRDDRRRRAATWPRPGGSRSRCAGSAGARRRPDGHLPTLPRQGRAGRRSLDRLIAECVDRVDDERAVARPADARLTPGLAGGLRRPSPAVGVEAASQTTGGPGEAAAINWILRRPRPRPGSTGADSVRFYAACSRLRARRLGRPVAAAGSEDAPGRRPRAGSAIAGRGHVRRTPTAAAVRNELEALRDRDVYGHGRRGLPRRHHRAARPRPRAEPYSHSMVPGGLLVMSRVTRLTSATSLVIRVEIVSSRS